MIYAYTAAKTPMLLKLTAEQPPKLLLPVGIWVFYPAALDPS